MKQCYKVFLLSVFVVFWSVASLAQSCTHTIRLTDTYGDGWNGGAVSVSVNGMTVLNNIRFNSGYGPVNFNFSATSGQTIRVWRTFAGSWPGEMRVQIVNNVNTVLLNTVQPTTGTASTGGHTCVGSCSGGGGGGCVGNCINSSAWGSANAPASPGILTINSCTYQSEYNTVSAVVAGSQYRSTYNLGGWITVRHTSPGGTVVATGATPLTWTAPVSGTYYIHYNTNNCCGTASSCGTSTIECLSCAAPAAPANDLVCNATGISCGQTLSGTTVNATNSGTGEAGNCGATQTQPGVWYVVAGNGQNMSASLCGTAWDSKISVFSGPNCASLSCVGGNDDNGPVCGGTSASFSWASSAGLNYYILVHGYNASSAFNLNLTCVAAAPPAPSSVSASSASICNGQNTTLTANGANGTVYWYTGGCGSTQVGTGNTLTVTPNATTTYFARNFNNGMFSATCASATITVNPVPVASASAASNPICIGSTSQLNTSVTGVSSPGSLQVIIQGGGYLDETSWTLTNSSGTVIGSGGPYGLGSTNTVPIGNSANGPYTFYIETQGAWNDNTANFTVQCNGSNVLSGYISGGQAVSQNVAACLSGAAVTYSWSPSASLTNPSIQNPIASPSSTTTYTVTATANGCSGSASTTVTVNPNISWANVQWPANASVNCGSGANIYGQVYSASLTPAAGVNNTIGVQIGVSSSNTNPATWPAGAWTNANYNVQSGNNDEYVANIGSNLAQGTYYYAFRYTTGATGCYVYGGTGGFWNGTNSINGVLTVGGLDWANLQHPGSGSMCQGGSYNVYGQAYEANITNAAGATAGLVAQIGVSSTNTNPSTWAANAWSNANFNVQVGNNDEFIGTISGLAPGTYYYSFRYKLANSCNYEYGGFSAGGGGFWNGSTFVNGSLVVNATPTISVNASSNSICQGNSVNLNATGASTYVWANNAGNTSNISVTPNATSTYTVTGTSNGCSGTGQVTVTVNAAPTISINASANAVCSGIPTTLTASGANTYSWNNGVTNGVAFTPASTQTYTVTGTAANGCSGTAQTTVTVNATPVVNAGPDKTGASTCGKDTTLLAAAALLAGQTGSWTIVSGGNGLVSMNTPNSQFQGIYGATYVLQWNVTQNGCTGTDQMTVTFNQPN
ncbi:MAG: beta strand repeat-containing protein, partial [Bacteroidota bacterium]